MLSLWLGSNAYAVQQPNGVTIPVLLGTVTTCANHNFEVCLDQSEGDPTLIDAQADALVAPETFKPTCTLTFTPITKGGNSPVAFGWYNVKPDPANSGAFLTPLQTELFAMINLPSGEQTGAQLAGTVMTLDLNQELAAGRYTGAEIGFFLASGKNLTLNTDTHALTGRIDRAYYTQHSLNPDSTPGAIYYQVLTWQSIAFQNAFYFGWEDLPASSGDNDFDDLGLLVTGVQCSGGGDPCDTGLDGVCALGTMQCKKGVLTCVQNVQAGPETCDALDDDCNAEVDEGDLCEADQVCDRGRCVPTCSTGEFRCRDDEVCTDEGLCVEAACAEKECPAGQVCQAGECGDGCSGVSCPYGRVCRNGACVDPCLGIECDAGFSCDLGVCKSCECTACGVGQVCAANLCVDEGCETMTCAEATHCALGVCEDNCAGVVCPAGQGCEAGECVSGASGPGGESGAGGGGGIVITGSGGTSNGTGTGGGNGGGAATGATASSRDHGSSGGCACTLSGGRSYLAWLGALFVAALVVIRRSRLV
ncbi:MAG TPA: DUF4114 domain-containing protein [Polyangiaceae bacterium]|nr:DUF4114 domain-containing protein [Polyangiaceae bacterium]